MIKRRHEEGISPSMVAQKVLDAWYEPVWSECGVWRGKAGVKKQQQEQGISFKQSTGQHGGSAPVLH